MTKQWTTSDVAATLARRGWTDYASDRNVVAPVVGQSGNNGFMRLVGARDPRMTGRVRADALMERTAFRCEAIVIPEDIAKHYLIDNVFVHGRSQFIQNEPLDADLFTCELEKILELDCAALLNAERMGKPAHRDGLERRIAIRSDGLLVPMPRLETAQTKMIMRIDAIPRNDSAPCFEALMLGIGV